MENKTWKDNNMLLKENNQNYLTLPEFLESDFAKDVLHFDGRATEWHIGERDRIIVREDKIFIKSYWDNGRQAESHNVSKKRADEVKVTLEKHGKIGFNHRMLVDYWLFFNGANLHRVAFLISNKAVKNNKNGEELNTYDMPISYSKMAVPDDDYDH